MDIAVGVFMLLVSVYILYISIKSSATECTKIVEYRYVPRTFEEEQREPVKVSEIFKRMFNDPTPRNGSYSLSP
jgi:hypothetical protein